MTLLEGLTKSFSNPKRDAQLAQWACYLTALTLLVTGILGVTSMGLNEFQLLVATVLIVQLALLMSIVGALVPVITKFEQDQKKNQ